MPTAKVLSKSFTQFNKIMYHGTNSGYYKSLISGVDLSSCKLILVKAFILLLISTKQVSMRRIERLKENLLFLNMN